MTISAAPPGAEILSVSTHYRGDVPVLRVVGEIDMASAGLLGAALSEVVRPARPVVVDLTGVSFLAMSGLNVLLQRWQDAAAADTVITLVANTHSVLRPIELTGLDAIFSVFGSVAEAVDDAAYYLRRNRS